MSASVSTPPLVNEASSSRKDFARPVLSIALCFAVVTGFVEAAALLLFQRINWANWGQTEHVSAEIFWVAPICDVVLFLPVALCLVLASLAYPKIPAVPAGVFLFGTLMFYDWLTVPNRLVHRSALILAVGLATVMFRFVRKRENAFLRFVSGRALWAAYAVVLVWAGLTGWSWAAELMAVKRLPDAKSEAPNVVIMVVDTLRADHLSAYGYQRPTSPNIDRITKQGVLFEHAISASSWTLPSHASLLSGRYSYEHGATDVKPPAGKAFDDRYPSLAETFMRQGYRTGAFSANYVYFSRDLGFGRGFAHFEDYFHSAFDSFSRTLYGREFSRLVLNRDRVRRLLIAIGFEAVDELQPNSKTSWMVRKRAAEVNREALSWMAQDPKRPFFVFLNYFDTHRPYGTPPGTPRKFLRLNTHDTYVDELSSPILENKIDEYDESIAYVDDQIGGFFSELTRRGLDKQTLVIITSDHGDLLAEHGLYGHRNALYLPLIHVPLIFWQPGHIPQGVRVRQPVSNVLVAATISSVLGLQDASLYPGPSLENLWEVTQPAGVRWPDPFSELSRFKDEGPKVPSRYGAMKSLVTPEYHYLSHEKFGAQLYRWKEDPRELSDLSKTSEGEAYVRNLANEVENRVADSR
jgi:arylsulfatase A-like enzyme